MLLENYFSTCRAQKRTIHVNQLFLKKCSVKDWRKLLACNISAACVGTMGRLSLALVRKYPAPHTPPAVKPIPQPPSGYQSRGDNAPHPNSGAPSPGLEWPTDWKPHLGRAQESQRVLKPQHEAHTGPDPTSSCILGQPSTTGIRSGNCCSFLLLDSNFPLRSIL